MRSKLKGFTLLELLVVISIIALLLSIIVPSLRKAKYQASHVVCKSQLHQWGLAVTTYSVDHDGFFASGAVIDGLRTSPEMPNSFFRRIDSTANQIAGILENYGFEEEYKWCPLMPEYAVEAHMRLNSGWSWGSVIGYSYWIQRNLPGQPDELWPKVHLDVDESDQIYITKKQFLRRVTDKNIVSIPIMSDQVVKDSSGVWGAPHLRDNPPLNQMQATGGLNYVGILIKGVLLWHAKSKVEKINRLYGDGRVETVEAKDIETHYKSILAGGIIQELY